MSSTTMLAITPQIMPRPVLEQLNSLPAALVDIWLIGEFPKVFALRDSEFRLHVFQ